MKTSMLIRKLSVLPPDWEVKVESTGTDEWDLTVNEVDLIEPSPFNSGTILLKVIS